MVVTEDKTRRCEMSGGMSEGAKKERVKMKVESLKREKFVTDMKEFISLKIDPTIRDFYDYLDGYRL